MRRVDQMRVRVGGLLAVFLLLLAPSALAAQASGHLTIEGPASFPSGTRLEAKPLGLLLNDTADLAGFQVYAKTLDVRVIEQEYLGVPGIAIFSVPTRQHERSWILNDAQVELLDDEPEGILGIYPGRDATMAFVTESNSVLEAREISVLTSGQVFGSVTQQERPHYYARVENQDHVRFAAPGTFSYLGSGSLLLRGPDVRLTAHNETDVQTGYTETDSPHVVDRWLLLSFESARVEVKTTQPVDVAALDVQIAWDGEARFTPRTGSIRAGPQQYVPTGAPAHLSGAFSASFSPLSEGVADLAGLQGDLRTTSLRVRPAPLTDNPSSGPSGLLVLGVVLGGGTVLAGGVLLHRRSRSRSAPQPRAAHQRSLDARLLDLMAAATTPTYAARNTAAWYVRGAELAGDREEWALALAAIRAARRAEPHEPRHAREEGTYLIKLGRHDEALAAFEEAAGMGDAYGALLAAAVAARIDQTSAADALLERALMLDPFLVGEVEAEPEMDFRPLRSRPAYKRAVESAWAKLGLTSS